MAVAVTELSSSCPSGEMRPLDAQRSADSRLSVRLPGKGLLLLGSFLCTQWSLGAPGCPSHTPCPLGSNTHGLIATGSHLPSSAPPSETLWTRLRLQSLQKSPSCRTLPRLGCSSTSHPRVVTAGTIGLYPNAVCRLEVLGPTRLLALLGIDFPSGPVASSVK